MHLNIRVRPSYVFYLLSIAVIKSPGSCLAVSAALLIHECGHYLVSRLTGEQIVLLELTPFGGIMTYADEKKPCKGLRGLAVAAAGPLANALCFYLLLVIIRRSNTVSGLIQEMMTANLAMIVINVFPALPLDGGRMLFSIGYYFLPAAKLIFVLSFSGVCLGIGCIFLAVVLWTITGKLNCSLLIIGGYLATASIENRKTMLAENVLTVLQEREEGCGSIHCVRFYRILKDTPLIQLLPILAKGSASAFIVGDMSPPVILDDTRICRLMLSMPSGTVWEAIQSHKQ